MATFNIKVRRISRVPCRLGKTNITNQSAGTTVDLNDPAVQRDFRLFRDRLLVIGTTA